jgi:hypothetical protein
MNPVAVAWCGGGDVGQAVSRKRKSVVPSLATRDEPLGSMRITI